MENPDSRFTPHDFQESMVSSKNNRLTKIKLTAHHSPFTHSGDIAGIKDLPSPGCGW